MIVPWNDRDAVEAALSSTSVAAILAEPYPANMGLVPPQEGFLAFLREQADANGALLVFDEVISGFRVARGGAQEREGVTPDLTILGKVIGGGLPAAAYAGRARPDGAGGAGGRRLPGGHAVGEPAGHRRRAGDAGAARRGGLRAAGRRSPPRSPDGLRELAAQAGVPVHVSHDHRPAHPLLPRRPGGRLRRRQALRHGRPRRLLPRDARARHLPAALAVRGVVPVAGAHRRARGAHARRRRGSRWRRWRR